MATYMEGLLKTRITELGKQKEFYTGERQTLEKALYENGLALDRANAELDELAAELELRTVIA